MPVMGLEVGKGKEKAAMPAQKPRAGGVF